MRLRIDAKRSPCFDDVFAASACDATRGKRLATRHRSGIGIRTRRAACRFARRDRTNLWGLNAILRAIFDDGARHDVAHIATAQLVAKARARLRKCFVACFGLCTARQAARIRLALRIETDEFDARCRRHRAIGASRYDAFVIGRASLRDDARRRHRGGGGREVDEACAIDTLGIAGAYFGAPCRFSIAQIDAFRRHRLAQAFGRSKVASRRIGRIFDANRLVVDIGTCRARVANRWRPLATAASMYRRRIGATIGGLLVITLIGVIVTRHAHKRARQTYTTQNPSTIHRYPLICRQNIESIAHQRQ